MKTRIDKTKVDTSPRERRKLKELGVTGNRAKRKDLYTLYELMGEKDTDGVAIFESFDRRQVKRYQENLR